MLFFILFNSFPHMWKNSLFDMFVSCGKDCNTNVIVYFQYLAYLCDLKENGQIEKSINNHKKHENERRFYTMVDNL